MRSAAAALLTATALTLAGPAAAEVANRGVQGKPLHEARPAPASIFPDAHIVVAQPSPSEVNPSFLGPVLLMKSVIVDLSEGAATLPLRKGRLESGDLVWSILTNLSDETLANLHGVIFSANMAYGITGKAARTGRFAKDGTFTFAAGKVDVSPEHKIEPGDAPNFFPPKSFQLGAEVDPDSPPLVQLENAKSAVFNMPMIAFDVAEERLDAMCEGNPTTRSSATRSCGSARAMALSRSS